MPHLHIISDTTSPRFLFGYDTVGKILPDYPNANVASKVKVRHLLSHTGGTGDIFGPKFEVHLRPEERVGLVTVEAR